MAGNSVRRAPRKRCSRCGQAHRADNCNQDPHCLHCNGPRASAFHDCPAKRTAELANQIKNRHCMPCADALRLARESHKDGAHPVALGASRGLSGALGDSRGLSGALGASRAQSNRKSYAQAAKDGPYIAPSLSNFISKTIIPATTTILTSVEPIDSRIFIL